MRRGASEHWAVVYVLTAALCGSTASAARAADSMGFDLWPYPNALPPADRLQHLPVLAAGETQGFVDLGFDVRHAGRSWRALQFTRDRQFGAAAPVGKYLFGPIGAEWPPDTVDAFEQLHRGRLVALVLDGQAVTFNPSRILDLRSEDADAALYNAFPRLLVPGRHSLQYVWEQIEPFYFVLPLAGPDPLGLDGRRVFVAGERVGDTLDGKMILSYDLNPPCADGVDNDGDELIDFPADPGCASPGDTSEENLTDCSDGVDNDGDELIDFPADAGCATRRSVSEENLTACSDGVDNDGDGFTDFPYDPHCYAATDPRETCDCADGADNDLDGQIDFPADRDCSAVADPSEHSAPVCANGGDDDLDGRIDFPADPDCVAAHDASEDSEEEEPSAPLAARVLVALATSGSLNGDVCTGAFTGGDGSEECPGFDVPCGVCGLPTCANGFPDDSRLFQLKRALAEVLLRDDAEFALLRSAQRATEFACPRSAVDGSGGWQGAGEAPCAGGFDGGQLEVSFGSNNFAPLWETVDGTDNYFGSGVPPPGFDFELRATGSRPLAGLLQSATTYLDQTRAGDSRSSCRIYRVLLLVDGGETCGGDAAGAAGELRAAGIEVHVFGYAVGDDASRAELDAVSGAGGTGAAVFLADSSGLSAALDTVLDRVAGEQFLVERCNGVDDDCDGLVDEDFPGVGQGCDNDLLGACFQAGTRSCSEDGFTTRCVLSSEPWIPVPEICNGIDDDCDGYADEAGVCGVAESCNALDDDGDGRIDEDFPVGESCSDTALGVCRASGVYRCLADGSGVTCEITQPGEIPATADTACDGRDEDCDGAVDEEAIDQMVTFGGFRIDRFEASRPDARAGDAGRMSHRACSQPGRLPWSGITWLEAMAACASSGKRLCTVDEWEAACAGNVGTEYPYGNSYDPGACNGEDYDPDGLGPDDDLLVPTGSVAGCVSPAGVWDMSGNLQEWTSTVVGPETERAVRGGSFTDQWPALACRFADDAPGDVSYTSRLYGFRCCASP